MSKKEPKHSREIRTKTPLERTEFYTVEIVRDLKTGAVEAERWWNEENEIHRPLQDGPAHIERDKTSGKILRKLSSYYLHGREVDQKGLPVPLPPPRYVHRKPRSPQPK
jgi:hypothetical protein